MVLVLALDPSTSWAAVDAPLDDLVRGRSPKELSRELARVKTRLSKKPRAPPVKKPAREVADGSFFGTAGLRLNLNQVDTDLRELQTTFTLPQAFSLSTLDATWNLNSLTFATVGVRNLTDDDRRFRIAVKEPSVLTGELYSRQSRFLDLPDGNANTRMSTGGSIGLSELTLLPTWFSFDRTSLVGRNSLGYRDWRADRFTLGTSGDLGVVGATLEVPTLHFTDETDPLNNVTSTALKLRLFSRLSSFRGSFDYQVHRLSAAASPQNETVHVVNVSFVSKKLYRIRGLEARSRTTFKVVQNQITQTARTKSSSEAFSTLTYRRYRNWTLELGGSSRLVKRRKLNRTGMQDVLGRRSDLTRAALDPFEEEDKVDVKDGWTSLSYRGIPHVLVHLRRESASLSSSPLTDVGTVASYGLLFDRRTGSKCDFVFTPSSPTWGLTLKYDSSADRNMSRNLERSRNEAALALRLNPWPHLSLSAELHRALANANTLDARTGLTDEDGAVLGLTCDVNGHSEFFAEVSRTWSRGALPAVESIMTVGLAAHSSKSRKGASRVTLSLDDLSSPHPLVTPYRAYLGSLEHRVAF